MKSRLVPIPVSLTIISPIFASHDTSRGYNSASKDRHEKKTCGDKTLGNGKRHVVNGRGERSDQEEGRSTAHHPKQTEREEKSMREW
jgi:hypothetical protein